MIIARFVVSRASKNATINRELTIARSAINYYNKHKDTNIKTPLTVLICLKVILYPFTCPLLNVAHSWWSVKSTPIRLFGFMCLC